MQASPTFARPLAYAVVLLLGLASMQLAAAGTHKSKKDYGLGFSVEIPAPEAEVLQAVQATINDSMIEGSKEYNKDKFIEKAEPAESSPLFPAWNEGGTVFYKVREKVLAPVNFEDSNDEGTLAVRYVVKPKDATRTILRIDAIFVEDFRRRAHPSDGSVENAEFKNISDRIDTMEAEKKQTEESVRHRQEEIARQTLARKNAEEEAAALAEAEGSAKTMEQRVEILRRQVERVVKAPGAPLKSAPFQTASSLKSLDAGSEVVILVVTPYWFGVETEAGQHGWVQRSQLESLP